MCCYFFFLSNSWIYMAFLRNFVVIGVTWNTNTPIGGPNFIITHKQYSHVVATHTVKTQSPKPREQLICVRMTQCFNSAYYNIINFFRLQSTHFLYLIFSENHSPLRFFIQGKFNLIDCNKRAIIHFICLWVVHTVLWD